MENGKEHEMTWKLGVCSVYRDWSSQSLGAPSWESYTVTIFKSILGPDE